MHVCARLAKIRLLLSEKYLFHQPYFSTRLKVVTLPKRFYFTDWACKSLVSFEAWTLLSNTLSQSEETGAKTPEMSVKNCDCFWKKWSNWTDAEIKKLLSIQDDDEISRQIGVKDFFKVLLYFQHSCSNVIVSRVLVHTWIVDLGQFDGVVHVRKWLMACKD